VEVGSSVLVFPIKALQEQLEPPLVALGKERAAVTELVVEAVVEAN
jgi:hypothetical protein